MKLIKEMSLVALGVGATIAYQKYSKSMMSCIEDTMNKMARKTAKTLDDME